jgi:polyphosphate kinase 2 (PPK2 family)
MAALQVELVRFQAWVKEAGARVAVVFEGRDAAGKGGAIKAFSENLNPRGARVVALAKPSEIEAGQWYFQRYIAQLPTAGEIVLFDRSWYNRGVVEHVFGFCSAEERAHWFEQVGHSRRCSPARASTSSSSGSMSAVHAARALPRPRARPLKQWKLSWIDAEGLRHGTSIRAPSPRP